MRTAGIQGEQAQSAAYRLPAATGVDRAPMAWGEREKARFDFRVALFQRRGLTDNEAQTWADRLYERDHERDDRRLCLECKHLRTGFACGKRQSVVLWQLQRCPQFTFETP